MNASGAISITLRSMSRVILVCAHHVVQRVVHRPQIRIYLLRHISGQKTEPLARLDRRPHEYDASHLLVLQSVYRSRNSEISLAGTGGANAECEIVVANMFLRYAV